MVLLGKILTMVGESYLNTRDCFSRTASQSVRMIPIFVQPTSTPSNLRSKLRTTMLSRYFWPKTPPTPYSKTSVTYFKLPCPQREVVASRQPTEARIEMLISYGAPIDSLDEEGKTPLYYRRI